MGTSGPSWSDGSSASGPTTATDGTLVLSGSAWFWLLSRTMDWPAMVRAAARLAGVSSAVLTRPASVSGWANMPARYFRVSTCRTSLLRVAMLTWPDFTSWGRYRVEVDNSLGAWPPISMVAPALMASWAASAPLLA